MSNESGALPALSLSGRGARRTDAPVAGTTSSTNDETANRLPAIGPGRVRPSAMAVNRDSRAATYGLPQATRPPNPEQGIRPARRSSNPAAVPGETAPQVTRTDFFRPTQQGEGQAAQPPADERRVGGHSDDDTQPSTEPATGSDSGDDAKLAPQFGGAQPHEQQHRQRGATTLLGEVEPAVAEAPSADVARTPSPSQTEGAGHPHTVDASPVGSTHTDVATRVIAPPQQSAVDDASPASLSVIISPSVPVEDPGSAPTPDAGEQSTRGARFARSGSMAPSRSSHNLLGSGATLVPVGDLCATEAAALAEFCFGYKVAPALTRAILAKSGRVARCVAQLVAHIEQRGGDMTTVSPAGIISARTLPLREMLARSWTVVSPAVSSQAAQRLDMLTPAAQTVLKVIACLSTPYAPVTRALAIALTTRILSTSSPATVRKDIALLQDIDILARVDTDKFFLAAAAGPDDHTYDAKNVSSPAGTYEHSTRQNFYCDENDHEGFKIVNPTLHDVVLSVTLAEQRKQVCKMAASLVVEEHATAIPAYLFAFAHFNFHGGNLDMFRRLITKGWADLKSTTEQDQKLRTAIVQFVAQDLFEKGLTAEDVGINLSDLDPDYQHDAGHEDDHGSPVSSPAGSAATGQPKIAKSVVACKNFLPPLSLGFLTMALRQTARTLYNLATKVAAGDQVPDEELASTRKFVAGYIKHTKRLDAAVEYFPIVRDEAALFAQWLAPPTDVASATRNAAEFLEYMQSVVRRRVELYEQYLQERMSLPEAPADPLWAGPERQALEHAMSNTLAAWPRSDVAAVRDGLMEMATQGWLPLNPDLTLEFQRDVYVRRRIQEPFCFLCFLYVNLSLHKDP